MICFTLYFNTGVHDQARLQERRPHNDLRQRARAPQDQAAAPQRQSRAAHQDRRQERRLSVQHQVRCGRALGPQAGAHGRGAGAGFGGCQFPLRQWSDGPARLQRVDRERAQSVRLCARDLQLQNVFA